MFQTSGTGAKMEKCQLIFRKRKKITSLESLRVGFFEQIEWQFFGPMFSNFVFCFRVPFTLITEEVIEAIIQCLLAQAEEAFMAQRPLAETECMLLQEFGNCTTKIIENAASFKSKFMLHLCACLLISMVLSDSFKLRVDV